MPGREPTIVDARDERERIVYVRFDDGSAGFVNLAAGARGRRLVPPADSGKLAPVRVSEDGKALVWGGRFRLSAHVLRGLLRSTPIPWVFVTYDPGFSEDLTSWTTEIGRDGRLRQEVRAGDQDGWEVFEKLLSPEEVCGLQATVAGTDLAACARLTGAFVIDNAETMCWEIEDAGRLWIMSAPLLSARLAERRDGATPSPAVDSALRLWNSIDALSPHGLQSNRNT